LIKSVKFDGVKKIGDPKIFASNYYNSGIDELLLVNNTGSLYNTQLDKDLIKSIRKNKALPITSGGGIKSLSDAISHIESGSDKIIINSLIHKNYKEAKKIVNSLGSSSVVGAIQFDTRNEKFMTLYEMAREFTNLSLIETIKKYIDLGVGEILLADINRDGCYAGLNEKLIDILFEFRDKAPLLIGGGFSQKNQIKKFREIASGLVISSAFHYKKINIKELISYNNTL
tara:strand:+ start:112 stop:798 length:687 start_codon:yes stop_codon:yes gene_type:complete